MLLEFKAVHVVIHLHYHLGVMEKEAFYAFLSVNLYLHTPLTHPAHTLSDITLVICQKRTVSGVLAQSWNNGRSDNHEP